MTRSSFRPIASVGLVAAVLAYVGCARTHETPENGSVSSDDKTPPQAKEKVSQAPVEATKGDKVAKFITEWSSTPPAGILLISGEQNGYPDPCGCTDGQLGGLGRRDDLIGKLAAKGWPLAKIDLGNLIHYRSDSSRGGRVQEKIKFDVIFEALGMMNYDAVALGPEDLKLGVMNTLGTLLNDQPPKFPVFLAGNVKPQEGLGSTISAIRLAKAGPITIGITSVIDPGQYQELQDVDAAALEVKSPDAVIPALLDELTKKAQVRVLMVQGPPEEAKRLAEKFPGFDIVVGTSIYEDPDERPATVNGGKTLLINNIGKKGKYVGVVGFFPGQTPMIQFRRQPLDDAHFHQTNEMRELIDVQYQERLKGEKVVQDFSRFANPDAPAGAKYVGVESCKDCHPRTYDKWTTTKHAKAFEPLTNPKRNRVYDAECISCHTTGFGYKSGWVSAEQTSFLKGNQCENCHGPASLHVAEPDNLTYRKAMHMEAAIAEKNNFCTKCHDQDNDHTWSFASRYPQIFHTGLDDFKDPKVHQGRPAKVAVDAK